MLPTPTLSFTLPSLHDDTRLACRVYHPASLDDPDSSRKERPWRGNAAVVAHPYAMMGGSYDDRIVDLIAGTLRHAGYLVATFNFRGASPSGGRTSWTSRAEQHDYASVVGFLTHYVHYLRTQPTTGAEKDAKPYKPILLLAGYSYGAMVTLKMPMLDTSLAQFTTPRIHTAAADIRLRAQHLAEQQNKLMSTPTSPRKSLGMRVGGMEDDSPRKSHDKSRRSNSIDREDKIRKGVKELLERTKLKHHHHHHFHRRNHSNPETEHDQKWDEQKSDEKPMEKSMHAVEGMTSFRSAYLVVSPPYGIVTNLATMTISNPFASWPTRKGSHSRKRAENAADPNPVDGTIGGAAHAADLEELKLTQHSTLAIYGDADQFLTLRKIRDWATHMGEVPGSMFQAIEVAGAGHFWVEDAVWYRLRDAVGEFALSLTVGQG